MGQCKAINDAVTVATQEVKRTRMCVFKTTAEFGVMYSPQNCLCGYDCWNVVIMGYKA